MPSGPEASDAPDAPARKAASPYADAWRLLLLVLAVGTAWQAWLAYGRSQLGPQLALAAAPGDIRMISSTTCGICTQARRWFEEHRVAFSECFIERDEACARQFQGLLAPGTPVIMVRGQVQLGFEPRRIAAALERPAPGKSAAQAAAQSAGAKPSSAGSPRP